MNFRVMARVLGVLFTLESVAMLVCGLFAYLDPHDAGSRGLMPLLVAAGVSCLLGLILILSGGKLSNRIPRREGILIVGLGWVFSAVLGSIPFVIGEPNLSPAAALFESVSGFTTTGATVI